MERSGPASAAVDAYLRDLVHGAKESNAGDKTGDKAGDTTTDHSDLPQPWTLPRVRHAEGFGRYAGVEGAGLAHEAGYDAWMTGAVFGALLRVAQAKGMAAEGPMGVERAMIHAIWSCLALGCRCYAESCTSGHCHWLDC